MLRDSHTHADTHTNTYAVRRLESKYHAPSGVDYSHEQIITCGGGVVIIVIHTVRTESMTRVIH